MKKEKVEMFSPWMVFVHQMEAFFEKDPEIDVVYDDIDSCINLFVNNYVKAEALEQIMPPLKVFGTKTVYVNIIPANPSNDEYKAKYFKLALEGNEAFDHIVTTDAFMSNPISFCTFKKEVVQYPNDDLCDEHGVCSALYQELAKEIFGEVDGIYFCTNLE